jgi:glycine betaine catabolism A
MQKVFHPTATTFVVQETLPAKYYTSPDILGVEKEKIFGGWTCVGHVSRIANPGDYFLAEIFGENLIVIHTREGRIKAFYNVCRHRGTRICDKDGRGVKSLQCPYHAWTYNTNGNLIGAPGMKGVKGFSFDANSLISVNLNIWDGFIFVSFSDRVKTFAEEFAPLIGRFKKWNIAKLVSYKRATYLVRANWKLIFLNFSECYHCASIHPLLSKLADAKSGNNDLTEGPFLGGYLDLTGDSMTTSGRTCAPYVGEMGDDEKRGYYYSILPNLLLQMHPDYVMFHLVFPLSAGESLVISEWLFTPGAFNDKGFRPEEAVEAWDITNKQDWEVCESAQKGISSKGYKPGQYSPRESLLAAFDRYYMRIMKSKR